MGFTCMNQLNFSPSEPSLEAAPPVWNEVLYHVPGSSLSLNDPSPKKLWASQLVGVIKNPSTMQETWV